MTLDGAAQVGEAVGGLAGLIALAWNIVDRVRRRTAARAPELLSLLTQIITNMHEVIREPQDDEWCYEKLEPARKKLDQLQPFLPSGIGSTVQLLSVYIATVAACGYWINDDSSKVAEVARRSIQQQEFARYSLGLANSIRRKWAAV